MVKVLFAGTPEVAVPSLRALAGDAEHFEVVAVLTRPDAPTGRGRRLMPSPVKQAALELGLPVIESDPGEETFLTELTATGAEAAAVVDPRRPDCPYPFKHLAGVGVALKLVLALGEQREDAIFARYCTLAAIGTIADVMPMREENRTIVCRGLEAISGTDFLGLRALLRETGLLGKEITSIQIGFVLAPRLNAAGRMGEAELAANLLLTDDSARAEELARRLCDLNRERQAVEQEIFAQAVEQIEDLPAVDRSALVLSSEVWHQGVVGIVASRLSEKYSCPSFMIHLQNGMGKGSCRSYGGFNLFAALESCADLLVDFGGHALAAGFNIREENIPAFRQRMNRCVREFCNGQTPVSSLEVDVTLRHPEAVTLEEVEDLGRLEPYGAGNNRPVFALMGAKVESMQSVGQNRHVKLRLSKGGCHFDAIFFSTTAEECGVASGSRVDAAFYLQINEFRGSSSVQLQMIDLRGSAAALLLGLPAGILLSELISLVTSRLVGLGILGHQRTFSLSAITTVSFLAESSDDGLATKNIVAFFFDRIG